MKCGILFQIWMQNVQCEDAPKTTCTRMITVKFNDTAIQLIDDYTVSNKPLHWSIISIIIYIYTNSSLWTVALRLMRYPTCPLRLMVSLLQSEELIYSKWTLKLSDWFWRIQEKITVGACSYLGITLMITPKAYAVGKVNFAWMLIGL